MVPRDPVLESRSAGDRCSPDPEGSPLLDGPPEDDNLAQTPRPLDWLTSSFRTLFLCSAVCTISGGLWSGSQVARTWGQSVDAVVQLSSAPRFIKILRTQQGTGDRLKWQKPLQLGHDFHHDGPSVIIEPAQTGQEILGFGGAFTEAAATVFDTLPKHAQDAVIEQYFGSAGLGYTLGRVPINSCDFSVDHYTFDDTAGDFNLHNFDRKVTHDKRDLIPFIRKAKEKVETTAIDTQATGRPGVAGKWEKFQAYWGINGPHTVALKNVAGKFLSAEDDGSVKVNNFMAAASTRLSVHKHDKGSVSLSGANGKFFVMEHDGSLRVDVDAAAATKFVQVNNADGSVSLHTHSGKFVSSEPGHGLRMLAAPWSPPAWMKTNGQMNGSGNPCLKPKARAAWAKYLSEWISSYKAAGIQTWGLSVQNEPTNNAGWEACQLNPQEEADFIANHLGPTLKADHPEVALFVFDDSKHALPEYVDAAMGRPEVSKFVHGAAFHWYSGDLFDKVAWVHQQHPDVVLLASEATYERRMWQAGKTEAYPDWRFGEGYAHDIIGDLNAGASGWIDWNLLLNTQGGPNHVGNVCDAAIVVDEKTHKVHVHPQYYFIGHFSKFISPGSRHINTKIISKAKYKPSQPPGPYGICTGEGGLEVTSALRPDKQVVVVVLNCALQDIEFKLKIDGLAVKVVAPTRSITTYLVPAL